MTPTTLTQQRIYVLASIEKSGRLPERKISAQVIDWQAVPGNIFFRSVKVLDRERLDGIKKKKIINGFRFPGAGLAQW